MFGTRPAYTGVPNTTRSLSENCNVRVLAFGKVKSYSSILVFNVLESLFGRGGYDLSSCSCWAEIHGPNLVDACHLLYDLNHSAKRAIPVSSDICGVYP